MKWAWSQQIIPVFALEKVFISPLFLKYTFPVNWILCWRFCSPSSTSNMLFHRPLASIASAEKSAVPLLGFPWMCVVFLLFSRFSPCLWHLTFLLDMSVYKSLSLADLQFIQLSRDVGNWLLSFNKLGTFMNLNIFFFCFLSFWYFLYTCVGVLHDTPLFFEALFIFLILFFSLCPSAYKISISLSSSLLILSLASSYVLFGSWPSFYCAFQLSSFHLVLFHDFSFFIGALDVMRHHHTFPSFFNHGIL